MKNLKELYRTIGNHKKQLGTLIWVKVTNERRIEQTDKRTDKLTTRAGWTLSAAKTQLNLSFI